jgi:hypothetical protein
LRMFQSRPDLCDWAPVRRGGSAHITLAVAERIYCPSEVRTLKKEGTRCRSV